MAAQRSNAKCQAIMLPQGVVRLPAPDMGRTPPGSTRRLDLVWQYTVDEAEDWAWDLEDVLEWLRLREVHVRFYDCVQSVECRVPLENAFWCSIGQPRTDHAEIMESWSGMTAFWCTLCEISFTLQAHGLVGLVHAVHNYNDDDEGSSDP